MTHITSSQDLSAVNQTKQPAKSMPQARRIVFSATLGLLTAVVLSSGLGAAPAADSKSNVDAFVKRRQAAIDAQIKRLEDAKKDFNLEFAWWEKNRQQFFDQHKSAYDNNNMSRDKGGTKFSFRLEFMHTFDNSNREVMMERFVTLTFSGDKLSEVQFFTRMDRIWLEHSTEKNQITLKPGNWEGLKSTREVDLWFFNTDYKDLRPDVKFKVLKRVGAMLQTSIASFTKYAEEIRLLKQRINLSQGASPADSLGYIR